jgi:3-deoxy-manno-octulosonate cytidylyltransferase (CMP-KDO synthetase)
MIKRVYDRACCCNNIDTVVVLTDDERINEYCVKNEMRCIVIEDDCATGTDRCAKALELLDGDIFVNIQGDEPLINPDAIDKLVSNFPMSAIVNAYIKINHDYKSIDKNVVKVAFDKHQHATHFSRLPISEYQQMGLYAFTRDMLSIFSTLPRGEFEEREHVEMFRYVENGYKLKMVEVDDEGLSVDTIEDLKRVEDFINAYN